MMEKVTNSLQTALAWVLIASVLLNCINIAGRYVFGTTITGADELQIFSMIAMTFLGLCVVSWRETHLRMDILIHWMPHRLKTALKFLERLSICVVCGLVINASHVYVSRMAQLGIRSENAHLPMWLMHAIVTLGLSLLVLVTLAHMLASVWRQRPPGEVK